MERGKVSTDYTSQQAGRQELPLRLNWSPLDQQPRIKQFLTNLREAIFPPKQPPLQVTAQPLKPEEMAGFIVPAPATETSPETWERLRARFGAGERVDSDHLDRLAQMGATVPGYRAFWENLRELLFPPKQPPLQVTSKPVAVKDIWGFYGQYRRRATLISAAIHIGAVALLFVVGAAYKAQVHEQELKQTVSLIAPDNLKPYIPKVKPSDRQMGGGGGGGDRSPLPPSKGQLPRVAPRQFVPPAAVIHNPAPRLVMEPTIVVPPEVPLPKVDIMAWGDPLAKVGPPSSGPGFGGGIGTGSGGGVGPGRGPGYGPGEGGGVGGGVYRIGGGVTPPQLIYKVEPEYSDEARKAKYQGTVVLYVVIDEKGLPRDIKVVRPLGLGLDEKAIEAVRQWRFRPGYMNGRPVAVAATIEINFRLL